MKILFSSSPEENAWYWLYLYCYNPQALYCKYFVHLNLSSSIWNNVPDWLANMRLVGHNLLQLSFNHHPSDLPGKLFLSLLHFGTPLPGVPFLQEGCWFGLCLADKPHPSAVRYLKAFINLCGGEELQMRHRSMQRQSCLPKVTQALSNDSQPWNEVSWRHPFAPGPGPACYAVLRGFFSCLSFQLSTAMCSSKSDKDVCHTQTKCYFRRILACTVFQSTEHSKSIIYSFFCRRNRFPCCRVFRQGTGIGIILVCHSPCC